MENLDCGTGNSGVEIPNSGLQDCRSKVCTRHLSTLLILAIGLGAFLFRLPRLEQRPLHTDEAVHAVKAGTLLDTGAYIYNPHEYHGPTLYYFALPFVRLGGARSFAEMRSVVPLRIVPVLFGTGLVFLLLLVRDGLGKWEAVFAAILTALSPAMVFYSRYYIQEMLLVFFTFAAIAAGWRYLRTKRLAWALLAGASLGLMHATKETCIIAYVALLGGGGLSVAWARWIDGRRLRVREHVHPWHAATAAKVAAVISILCLTAFLSNPRATVDSIQTYIHYLHRAGAGEGSTGGAYLHRHPWYFYLQTLAFARYGPGPWWSEGLILLLASLGILKSLKRSQSSGAEVHLLRLLAFYTMLMTVAYSVLPYKTPWCLMGFWHGMILMAAVGVVSVFRSLAKRPLKVLAGALLGLGLWHLGLQAWRASFVYDADTRNPYVYGHTSPDLLNLVRRIKDLSKVHPDGDRMVIQVIAPENDYWPLPWYLRRFENVGYYDALPGEPTAPVVITMPSFEAQLDAALGGTYVKEFRGLRPEVLLLLYVQQPLWNAFLE